MDTATARLDDQKESGTLISFQRAQQIVLESASQLGTQNVGFCDALGYVLAEPIIAHEDQPSFNASAVDGFALRSTDVMRASKILPINLRVIGEASAGHPTDAILEPLTAIGISTGAPIPAGADAVVMSEDVQRTGNEIWLRRSVRADENVRMKGEELKKGETVLEAGTVITPSVLALMASISPCGTEVHRKPWVSVVTTGDELIAINQKPAHGKIRDSNAIFLNVALHELGMDDVTITPRVKDEAEALQEAIESGLETSDVLIVAGGLSIGEHDLVRSIFKRVGVIEHFWGINVKPGKPMYFGRAGETLVFGLPGNPLAVGILFYEFIRPALFKMMGHRHQTLEIRRARLDASLEKKSSRMEFVPGHLVLCDGEKVVKPLDKHRSHMLSGFAQSNCLICFPEDERALEQGETVEVHLLPLAQVHQQDQMSSVETEGGTQRLRDAALDEKRRDGKLAVKNIDRLSNRKDPSTCPFCE